MTPGEIRDAVQQAIVKVTRIPREVHGPETFRDDLGLDSLSFLETLVEVQYRFQIPDATDTDYATILTVDDAVGFVQRHLCAEAVAS